MLSRSIYVVATYVHTWGVHVFNEQLNMMMNRGGSMEGFKHINESLKQRVWWHSPAYF